MKIDITTHTTYESNGIKFTTSDNELLVVADYWIAAKNAGSKYPLDGFGSNTFSEFSHMSQGLIVEAMKIEYGEKVASTGIVLLNIPKLVMRFTVGIRS